MRPVWTRECLPGRSSSSAADSSTGSSSGSKPFVTSSARTPKRSAASWASGRADPDHGVRTPERATLERLRRAVAARRSGKVDGAARTSSRRAAPRSTATLAVSAPRRSGAADCGGELVSTQSNRSLRARRNAAGSAKGSQAAAARSGTSE